MIPSTTPSLNKPLLSALTVTLKSAPSVPPVIAGVVPETVATDWNSPAENSIVPFGKTKPISALLAIGVRNPTLRAVINDRENKRSERIVVEGKVNNYDKFES